MPLVYAAFMSPLLAAEPSAPALVHYLPIATTFISLVFLIALVIRGRKVGWKPHMCWWAIGVATYGLGTGFESVITLFGNSPALNTGWYWAGAILGGYPLATGSVYLLMNRKVANILTTVTMVFVVLISVAVFLSPVDMSRLAAPVPAEFVGPISPFSVETSQFGGHRPGGAALEWSWVRAFTPLINTYAAVFLIGGAVYSSVRFLENGSKAQRRVAMTMDALARIIPAISIADLLMPRGSAVVWPRRAVGTALIALGALLPGIGGGMAKGGIVEALYIGEFFGLILIWIGYEQCIMPRRTAEPSAPV